MKKSTFFIGVTSCILFALGIFFKIQHWPGGSTLLVAGAALFALCYSVMLWIDKNALTKNDYQKSVNLFTMLAMTIIMICFVIKAMHWPHAGIAIFIGHFILLALIPVLFIQGSKETDPVKKLNFNHSAIMLVILTAFSFFIWLVIGTK
jgi:hypothetical protein